MSAARPQPKELEAMLARARLDRCRSIGSPGLTWLALVPSWTDVLAERCGFPTGDGSLAEFIERAAAAGLCDLRWEHRGSTAALLHFWMPDIERADVLAAVRQEDPDIVRMAPQAIAGELLDAARDGTAMTQATRRWAETALAAAGETHRGGAWLDERIRDATGRADTGDALAWIAAGERLTPVLGGELRSVVARGKRRINLEYRRRQDERALGRFLRRDQQMDALTRLLRGPDDAWALHLIGMGGVGKTMLIRYIAAAYAADARIPSLAVGRVDFDHIDPRFPWERPAQLLVELADALALHAETGEQEGSLDAFLEHVRQADEEGPADAAGDPLAPQRTPAFEAALDAFCTFLAQLPGPVVLVLDTCEELAKLHPAGASVPSVDAMFEILERVHERVPALRVLLAGRRLLATEGDGWALDAARLPSSLVSLERRPYLSLLEVRGFDATEATRLLRDVRRLDLRPAVLDAILAESRETGRVPGVPGGRDEGPARDRFNPFDLALYTDWLEQEPDLDAGEISSGRTDAYVESRIVQRLHDEGVDAALAGVALLGRFDLAMLAPALPSGDAERRRTMAVLAEQEWVDLEGGEHADEFVIGVEPHLLPRLRRWFEAGERAPELDAVREPLQDGLRRRALEGPLDGTAVEAVEAALRLLPAASGALLCETLEERVASEAEWAWAAMACPRLLADDEETGEPRNVHARPALRALLIAARRHQQPLLDVFAAWDELERELPALEPSAHRERLAFRAVCGRLAGAPAAAEPARASDVEQLERRLSSSADELAATEQGSATLLAAAEGLLEAELPWGVPVLFMQWIDRVPATAAASSTLKAFALSLSARAAMRAGDPNEARSRFFAAQEAAAADAAPLRQRWSDWIAPGSPVDRIRLEWILHEPVAPAPERLKQWMSEASGRLELVDAERFCSYALQSLLARGPVDAAIVDALASADESTRERTPRVASHRAAPPLFVAVATAMAAAGRADAALDVLERRDDAATSWRGAAAAEREESAAARLALLGLVRRMRLGGRQRALLRQANQDSEAPDFAAQRAAAALVLEPQPPGSTPLYTVAAVHAAWQTATSPGGMSTQALDAATINDVGGPVMQAHIWLDIREAALLRLMPAPERPDADPDVLPDGELTDRLRLRRFALGVGKEWPYETRDGAWDRATALLALEEGELLALRLPRRALELLEPAFRALGAVGTPADEVIAGTTWAMALLRSGQNVKAKQVVDGIRASWDELASAEHLPHWDALRAWRSSPDSDAAWDGWTDRLAACRRWLAGDPPRDGPAELVLPDPEAAQPPAPPPPQGPLAAMAEAMAAPSAGPPELSPHAPPAPAQGGRRVRGLGELLAVALSLAALVLAVVSGGATARTLGVIAGAVAGLALFGALGSWLAARAVRRGSGPWLRRFGRASCLVLGRRGSATEPGRASLELQINLRFPSCSSRWEIRDVPFGDGAPPEPPELLEPIRRGPAGVPPIILDTPAELALHAWEGTLAPGALAGMRGGQRGVHVWRLAGGSGGRPWFREWSRQVLPVCDDDWLPLLESAWTPSGRRIARAGSAYHLPNHDVMHVIGTPALASGGWKVRLDSPGRERSGAKGEYARTADQEQALLHPARLPAARPGLLIVQAAPGPTDRLGTDGLRAFAAEAVAGGAYAALVVPCVPVDVATGVTWTIAHALPVRPAGSRALLNVTAAVRHAVWAGVEPDRADAVAHDVCLFAPNR